MIRYANHLDQKKKSKVTIKPKVQFDLVPRMEPWSNDP
jgi:hypothetical protein